MFSLHLYRWTANKCRQCVFTLSFPGGDPCSCPRFCIAPNSTTSICCRYVGQQVVQQAAEHLVMFTRRDVLWTYRGPSIWHRFVSRNLMLICWRLLICSGFVVQLVVQYCMWMWVWMWILNLYSAISWSISIALSTLVFREKYSLQTTPKAAAAERWITETVR